MLILLPHANKSLPVRGERLRVHLKSIVFRDRPALLEDLTVRITGKMIRIIGEMIRIQHTALGNVLWTFQERLVHCFGVNCDHFENLLCTKNYFFFQ